MAWTQADVDALQTAIAEGKGARSIAFADQVVTFNSISEMLQLLATMQRAVTGGSRSRLAATSKGT